MHLRIATILALLAGFFGFAEIDVAQGQISQDIPWPTKSWQVSTPEEQGMDSASLARLIETVGTYRQDSLMIIRHGKIVADAYYAPYVAGISHDAIYIGDGYVVQAPHSGAYIETTPLNQVESGYYGATRPLTDDGA